MRLVTMLSAIVVASAAFSPTAHADTLPVGTYYVSGHTVTTTIHASPDQGTLTGTLNFSTSSVLTSANLLFQDTTDGLSFAFTVPGLTTYTPGAHTFSATIYNASNPSLEYFFSVVTGTGNGGYALSCGVDCDTDALVPNASGMQLSEEIQGTISPVPEPSTFALLGTGLAAIAGAVRRRVR